MEKELIKEDKSPTVPSLIIYPYSFTQQIFIKQSIMCQAWF